MITFDNPEVNFYKDGTLFSTDVSYTGGTINDNGGRVLGIGARPNGTEWLRNFEGFMLDLRVYKNVKWSAAQVALDYKDTFTLYRSVRRVYKAPAAVGGLSIPVAMHHYTKNIGAA